MKVGKNDKFGEIVERAISISRDWKNIVEDMGFLYFYPLFTKNGEVSVVNIWDKDGKYHFTMQGVSWKCSCGKKNCGAVQLSRTYCFLRDILNF